MVPVRGRGVCVKQPGCKAWRFAPTLVLAAPGVELPVSFRGTLQLRLELTWLWSPKNVGGKLRRLTD